MSNIISSLQPNFIFNMLSVKYFLWSDVLNIFGCKIHHNRRGVWWQDRGGLKETGKTMRVWCMFDFIIIIEKYLLQEAPPHQIQVHICVHFKHRYWTLCSNLTLLQLVFNNGSKTTNISFTTLLITLFLNMTLVVVGGWCDVWWWKCWL